MSDATETEVEEKDEGAQAPKKNEGVQAPKENEGLQAPKGDEGKTVVGDAAKRDEDLVKRQLHWLKYFALV